MAIKVPRKTNTASYKQNMQLLEVKYDREKRISIYMPYTRLLAAAASQLSECGLR